jgi:hypothetical protein
MNMALSIVFSARRVPVALLVVALGTCTGAWAQAGAGGPLRPGQYVAEGGMGQLALNPLAGGALAFQMDTVGGNGHTCSLEGELRQGLARLEGSDDKTPCRIRMRSTTEGVEVKDLTPGACSGYCGMRASFEGLYLLPAPHCSEKAVNRTRKRFKQQYDARQHAMARDTLAPLLSDCARVLGWPELGRIRNDMAVTLYHLGDLAGCRAVLDPLAEDARSTDADIRRDWPPTDADIFLPIARATRTNLKLCKP